VREIPLTKGYAALIDDMDYEFISRHPWCALVTGKNIKRVYAMRRETAANGKSLYILMHRQIMGPAPGIVVDHINHNTLDCQRSNLRLATRRQNLANGRKAIGISGYRGVSRANQKNGWSVIVDHAYHGTFQDKENAARHYDMIAKQVYGEFATLNFPESCRTSKQDGYSLRKAPPRMRSGTMAAPSRRPPASCTNAVLRSMSTRLSCWGDCANSLRPAMARSSRSASCTILSSRLTTPTRRWCQSLPARVSLR
jgi:hypothetical protein